MKIYYSNISGKFNWSYEEKLGVLMSYHGLSSIPTLNFCDSFFLDSGAFSAFRQNISIDIDKYCDFLNENKSLIDVYAALDVIGDPETSKSNYTYMRKRGLEPLPAVHYNSPLPTFDFYLKNTDYIALGGIALKNKKERLSWLDLVFHKYSGVKFHGFGVQDRDILKRYPWHSVDSSSWHVMARFGGICNKWGDFKISKGVNSRELKWRNEHTDLAVKDYIESLGLDYDECCDPTSKGTDARSIANILYYEELSKQVPTEFIHRDRGFF